MTPILLAVITGLVVVGSLLWILTRKPEMSSRLTAWGAGLVFLTAMLFTVWVPSFNENWSPNTSKDQGHYHVPYTPQQLRGRLVYQREGCVYCHTQQVRPLYGEMKRYSIGTSLAIPADEREYVYDEPHFLGTRRIGPDLSRVGGKYSDDWHYSHFYYPRQMVPGSVMPAFTWLFDKDQDGNPIPNQDLRDLTAYVQSLGYERQVYDPTLNGGQGGWRSWLKPQDQQVTQALSASQVNRAATPVRGGDQLSPTNRVPSTAPGAPR